VKITGGNVADVLRGPLGWVVVGGVVILAVYWLAKKATGAIGDAAASALNAVEAPFRAAGAAIGNGLDATGALAKDAVTAETQALTANTDGTGNAVLDSLSVGAAGGG
jgi:hypothetical protein